MNNTYVSKNNCPVLNIAFEYTMLQILSVCIGCLYELTCTKIRAGIIFVFPTINHPTLTKQRVVQTGFGYNFPFLPVEQNLCRSHNLLLTGGEESFFELLNPLAPHECNALAQIQIKRAPRGRVKRGPLLLIPLHPLIKQKEPKVIAF